MINYLNIIRDRSDWHLPRALRDLVSLDYTGVSPCVQKSLTLVPSSTYLGPNIEILRLWCPSACRNEMPFYCKCVWTLSAWFWVLLIGKKADGAYSKSGQPPRQNPPHFLMNCLVHSGVKAVVRSCHRQSGTVRKWFLSLASIFENLIRGKKWN